MDGRSGHMDGRSGHMDGIPGQILKKSCLKTYSYASYPQTIVFKDFLEDIHRDGNDFDV